MTHFAAECSELFRFASFTPMPLSTSIAITAICHLRSACLFSTIIALWPIKIFPSAGNLTKVKVTKNDARENIRLFFREVCGADLVACNRHAIRWIAALATPDDFAGNQCRGLSFAVLADDWWPLEVVR